jgi:hypothetical protein
VCGDEESETFVDLYACCASGSSNLRLPEPMGRFGFLKRSSIEVIAADVYFVGAVVFATSDGCLSRSSSQLDFKVRTASAHLSRGRCVRALGTTSMFGRA